MRVEHLSSRADWQTPAHVLDRVRKLDRIGLDPASSKGNPTRARVHLTPERDGLTRSWTHSGLVFVNPPYGRAHNRPWARKIRHEAEQGAEIVALVAARTGSQWFTHMWTAQAICFVAGRLQFVGAENSAPFDSALCYWGERADAFVAAMKDLGTIIQP